MHAITVGWVPNNHGYPYKATCTCGWTSRGYVTKNAATHLGNAHLTDQPKG